MAKRRIGTLLIALGIDPSEFEKGLRKTQRRLSRLSRDLGSAGRGLTTGLTVPIAAFGAAALKASIDFEDAFADVRKTVKGADAELGQSIRDLSTKIPVTAGAIASVVEELGRLGIAKDHVLDAAEAMLRLQETSNLSANEAAVSIARMANVMGTSQGDIDRMASSITVLGSEFATSEREIIAMAERITAAGRIAGLAETDVLALSTALTSVGIKAEAGGTAITRVLQEIKTAAAQGGEKLEILAGVAGMTGAEFQQAFERDAGRALLSFISGLSNLEGQGARIFEVLGDLDFGAIRVKAALLNSALAVDTLEGALDRSRAAWRENSALVDLSEKRFRTTGSQIKILVNEVSELFRSVGDELTPALRDIIEIVKDNILPTFTNLVQGFAQLDAGTKKWILTIAAAAASIGPVLIALGALVASLRAVYGVVLLISRTPIGLAATALAALGVAAGAFAVDARSAKIETRALSKEIEGLKAPIETAIDQLRAFEDKVASQAVLEQAIEGLKKKRAELEAIIRDTAPGSEAAAAAARELATVGDKYDRLSTLAMTLFLSVRNTNEELLRSAAAQERLVDVERRINTETERLNDHSLSLAESQASAARMVGLLTEKIRILRKAFGESHPEIANAEADLSLFESAVEAAKSQLDAVNASGAVDNLTDSVDDLNVAAEKSLGVWGRWAREMYDKLTIFSEFAFDTMQQFSAGVGQAVGRALVFAEDFGEAITNVFKQIASSIIATLVDLGIQFLLHKIFMIATGKAQALALISAKAAETFATVFTAYVAANPFFGAAYAGPPAAAAAAALTAGALGLLTFAEGGIVTGPTLAMVGDNPGRTEAIIPIEKLPKLMEGFRGGNVVTILEMDGRTLAEVVMRNESGVRRAKLGGRV